MKLMLLVMVMVLGTCKSMFAASAPTVAVSTGVSSQYLAFGSGAVLYDNPTVQTDLVLSWDSGPYVGLWHSSGFDSKWNNNLGDELDYKIGLRKNILGFDVHVGFMYFDEPNVFTLGAGDIYYTHASVSRNLTYLIVTLGFENYITAPKSGFEGGNLFSLGVAKGFDLRKDMLTLGSSLAAVYDDGGFGLDDGVFLRGNVSLTWLVNKHLSFTAPSLSFYLPFGVSDVRENEVVVYGGVTYKF